MKALQEQGFELRNPYPGVYYVERPGAGNRQFPFPIQIIVTEKLRKETHSGLRVLRKHADGEDILRFLTEARQAAEPGEIANVNAILSVSVAANAELYAKVRRKTDMLYPALRELMKEDLEERWEKGREEGREEGWEEGIITGTVAVYRDELGLDDGTIRAKIAARFRLTEEQAARYVQASITGTAG